MYFSTCFPIVAITSSFKHECCDIIFLSSLADDGVTTDDGVSFRFEVLLFRDVFVLLVPVLCAVCRIAMSPCCFMDIGLVESDEEMVGIGSSCCCRSACVRLEDSC